MASWEDRQSTDLNECNRRTEYSEGTHLCPHLIPVVGSRNLLLEGRILTLQRPEATGARLTYALVANNLIGIGGSVLVVRFLSNSGEISARQVWFRGPRHAQSSTPFGPATPQKESTQAKNHSPDTP
jgi:hypothetical protein